MKAPLFDINAQKIGEITLPKSVFEAKINTQLVSQTIRVFLANKRSANAKVKDRGEVSGTTKKMWAQKGTGRARHGSAKAPQFVGGGKAHAPTGLENYSLKLNKKIRRAAIKSLLSQFAQDKHIIVVDKISKIEPKTKIASVFVNKLGKESAELAKSKNIGIITADSSASVKRAFGNIKSVNLLSLKSLNGYDLAKQRFLLITKKAVTSLVKL